MKSTHIKSTIYDDIDEIKQRLQVKRNGERRAKTRSPPQKKLSLLERLARFLS